jgi:probable rRNA maturation factor
MNIELSNESGVTVDEAGLISVAEFAMQHMGLNEDCDLAISIVDESRMSELHEEWMDLPGPTDVLSFPMDEMKPHDIDPGIVGDIVLCPQFAAAQAKNGLESELALLTIHGVLHCLGYDHAEPVEEKVMFELQESILSNWQQTRSAHD